jgi:integrase
MDTTRHRPSGEGQRHTQERSEAKAEKGWWAMSKHQTGHIWRVGRSWYGRYRRDEIRDGEVVRVQHSEKLCTYGNRYRAKKDVQSLLDEKLKPLNDGTAAPESTLTIAKYVEDFYFPYAESELKASTVHGYRGLWRMYLKPHLTKVSLRDFTCGQACTVLKEIYKKKKLSSKSLRHCKGLMQTIFAHAIQNDVLQGDNPVRNAKWPKAAQAAGETHAYTVQEMTGMLNTLTGTARIAVGLIYFCGLRPGEARAARWSDYDAAKGILKIQRSIWRKHETGPKTEKSIAPVPVNEMLRTILSETPRSSEFVLATPTGCPIDLHNLAARSIVPSLKLCVDCAVCGKRESNHKNVDHEFQWLQWKGFYALRRGICTTATEVESDLAAMSLLRHANISTTRAHYIKPVDALAVSAVDKISGLFDNVNGSGRPN